MVIGKRRPPDGVVLKRKLFQARSARRLIFFPPKKTHLNPDSFYVRAGAEIHGAILTASRRAKSPANLR